MGKKQYMFNETMFYLKTNIFRCGSADIHGCEKLAIDYTKPYPECCPKFKCGEKIVTPPYS